MTEPLIDVDDYRDRLVEKLENLAAWRKTKAAESPEDERNAQSAVTLRTSAAEVLALSDRDPRLRGLATVCQAHNDNERMAFVEAEDRIVSQHGFGADATLSTDDLLTALTRAATEAAHDAADQA